MDITDIWKNFTCTRKDVSKFFLNSCRLSSGVPIGTNDLALNCNQYANDLEIISKFPFKMNLDPQKQGPGISTAFLDETGSSVPDGVFCLKHLESLYIMNMNLIDGKENLYSLLIMKDCSLKVLCQILSRIFHCCSVSL